MHTLRFSIGILIVNLGLAGCSSTAGLRTGVSPKMRTIASIGDKPMPAVTGEPGESVATEEYSPERPKRSRDTIIGRVLDDRGEPVADARVRLAVGGTAGGKVVRATTDRSGAFTLHGVRPGSSYTIIAESGDGPDALTGRARVRASDAEVKISLAPEEAEAIKGPGSRRVSPISDAKAKPDEVDRDENGGEETLEPRAKAIPDDSLPPAPEAESLASEPARPSSAAVVQTEVKAPGTARWRKGETSHASTPSSDKMGQTSDGSGSLSPTSPPDDSPGDDDGPNPLPPALEPGQTSARTPASPASESHSLARSPTPSPSRKSKAAAAGDDRFAVPETYTPIALVNEADRRAARAAIVDKAPVVARNNDVFEESSSSARGSRPLPPLAPTSAAAGASIPQNTDPFADPVQTATAPADPFEQTSVEPVEPTALAEPPTVAKTDRAAVTWGELTANLAEQGPAVPLEAESARRPTTPLSSGPPRSIAGLDQTPRARAISTSPSEPSAGKDDGLAYCRYDARLRRIVDFRLPDLQGNPVRFQDLNADLILIDFWGTWCGPCVSSVPHLVDLQRRMGPRLKVVGIACEQGPREQRPATVAKTVQRLGINYPVLLSGMDSDSCPVQHALQVQAFPTLILVDRQGQILWRGQGATPTTIGRLTDFLATATKSEGVRRY